MDVREKLIELLSEIIDGGFKWHNYLYESGEQLNIAAFCLFACAVLAFCAVACKITTAKLKPQEGALKRETEAR